MSPLRKLVDFKKWKISSKETFCGFVSFRSGLNDIRLRILYLKRKKMEFNRDKSYFCSMRYYQTLCMVLFLWLGLGLQAQTGNPFDMEHKVSKTEKWTDVREVSLPGQETDSNGVEVPKRTIFSVNKVEGNPFDIGSKSTPVEAFVPDPLPKKKKKRPLSSNSTLAKIKQFKLIATVILLIAIALISTLLRHVIIKVYDGFKSDNLLRTYFRMSGRRVSTPNMILELFFILNASFAVFLLMEVYNYLGTSPFVEFMTIFAFIAALVYFKHFVLYIIKEVFPIKKEASEYNFTINVFLSVLGLILMPCNLILAYAPDNIAKITLAFMGIATSIVFGYLAFRSLLIGSKFLSSNRFHFFMYLCTVEIAPLFILFKVVNNYLGS